jgi:hypothetical protein
MSGLPAIPEASPVDLIRDSIEQVLAVSFPKSKAAGYAPALNLAQQADKYEEVELSGSLFHYAVFGRSKEQVGRALALTRYLQGVKATQFYARGQLILERNRIEDVLSCFMEANACNDHRAHCNKVITDPFIRAEASGLSFDLGDMRPTASYLLPCAFLTRYGAVALHNKHPASPEDQLQARAVKLGCDWCPNFNQADFKKL